MHISVSRVFFRSSSRRLSRLTGEIEADVPMALGRRVGWRGGARGVALLEGRGGGRCGRGGGGRIAAGVQLAQHRRMILAGGGGMQTTPVRFGI